MITTNYNTTEYAQELSNAELEQVNGGYFPIYRVKSVRDLLDRWISNQPLRPAKKINEV